MGHGYSIKARGKGEAEILIYEDIGEGWNGGVTAKQFADDLGALGNVGTIHLRISSLGGDVEQGLAIYRRLVEHPANVITHIDGWAASIAAVVAMAGNEIRIAEAGAVMIHNAHAIAAGFGDDLRAVADRLDAVSASIADVFVKRTGNTLQKVRDWMQDETWFYGQDAVDAKFADKVVENLAIAAHFDPKVHNFKNAPASLKGTPNLIAARKRVTQMKTSIARNRIG